MVSLEEVVNIAPNRGHYRLRGGQHQPDRSPSSQTQGWCSLPPHLFLVRAYPATLVNEPVLNTELARYLAKGLARALSIPESTVRIQSAAGHGRRAPDIQIVDLLGVRIVVQGKIERLDQAIEDCKDSIENGIADACFAAAYPRALANLMDIEDIEKALPESKINIALVKPPGQLTLEGWPEDSIKRLGLHTPSELIPLLKSEAIYDEIVGVESAERIAEAISEVLRGADRLPRPTQQAIKEGLSEVLGVSLEVDTKKEEGEEDA